MPDRLPLTGQRERGNVRDYAGTTDFFVACIICLKDKIVSLQNSKPKTLSCYCGKNFTWQLYAS